MTDRNYRKQAPIRLQNRKKARLMLTLLGLSFAALLPSCGKKPGTVDPPPEVTDDRFPSVYPDPTTDPKP